MSAKTIRPLPAVLFLAGLAVALLLVPGSPSAAQTGATWPEIELLEVTGGLSRPVYITHAGDGSGRLFVVERAGRIRIVRDGALQATPFLDIADRVRESGSEEGLLSVAFAPGYAANGRFYVYYTNVSGDNVVARFNVSADPDVADPGSESLVLHLPHPDYANHNGGQLAFGPDDGELYVSTGDGGGSRDPNDNGQNLGSLLGKILRIAVEPAGTAASAVLAPSALPAAALARCGTTGTYDIPATNPFTATTGACGEIWALGLRNPWRFSFDRLTADLYVGDVGQGRYEEIDFQPAASAGGANYGWDILEGNHCFEPSTGCAPPDGYVPPIHEYPHQPDPPTCSVTGGFVYRGSAYPRLQGIYLYADYCSGQIWGLRPVASGWENHLFTDVPFSISTFGEDEAGNVYLALYSATDGAVYRIADQQGTATPSATPTSSPTAGATASSTRTATATPTQPPAATVTPTARPSASGTPTLGIVTSTPTGTRAPAGTTTPSQTASATTSPPRTAVPTETPTVSATATPTVPIAATMTPTPEGTTRPTRTASPSRTASVTTGPAPTSVATATPTAPVTGTASATATASATTLPATMSATSVPATISATSIPALSPTATPTHGRVYYLPLFWSSGPDEE